MIAVIGSGPAGVSAARALAARGQRVALFDAGMELEAERRGEIDRLATQPPDEWDRDSIDVIRDTGDVGVGGVMRKLSYGSDFPHRDVARWLPFENHGSDARPTLARGGFSTVWGSCVLPYLDEDLADWPLTSADLAPHYRAVMKFLPLAATHDALAEEFPLYCETPQQLAPSAQARALMHDLDRARRRLAAKGLRFGWSRTAVRAEESAAGPGCVYCGLCLQGCPHRLIYDASATLDQLLASDAVEYRKGVVVERFEERGGDVELELRSIASGDRTRTHVERVYVGCGAIATTRLLLASLECYDRPVTIRDSQYFLLPWLRARGVPRPRDEALHTLCQAFLELRDPRIDPRNVHLQIYTYNDLYARLFDRLLGPLRGAARPLIDAVLARLLLIQGYLHSDASPTIEATLERRADTPVLQLVERRNPRTRPVVRRLVARLVRLAPELGALPVVPALRIAPAGRGFHSGGSFPMHERPGELECDLLGRPHGLERVHLIDSSTFPTIPSTTITLTVMANAHRIASTDL
ncbi:MAG: GMC oxidoreductase [Myxococcota bacterium]|nr:GMC oxidoreductase [Myxococcota bacterium]